MTKVELIEHITRLQEINILLSQLYAERKGLSSRLYTDEIVGPALSKGGSVEVDGYGVKAVKHDPAKVSDWERKNGMVAPTGHILKLKLTLPKKEGAL